MVLIICFKSTEQLNEKYCLNTYVHLLLIIKAMQFTHLEQGCGNMTDLTNLNYKHIIR